MAASFLDEKKVINILKGLIEDIYIPALIERVENGIFKDLDRQIEVHVNRVYNEQINERNAALAQALTKVIELLAMRQVEGTI